MSASRRFPSGLAGLGAIVRPVPISPRLSTRLSRPYSNAPTSLGNANIRRNALISASLIAAAGVAYYYETTASTTPPTASSGGYPNPFTLRIGDGRGGIERYTFDRKSESETAKMLLEHENSTEVNRPGNPVIRYDTNYLGSNEPCEDRSASDLIPRASMALPKQSKWFGSEKTVNDSEKPLPQLPDSKRATEANDGSKDFMMFSILDGHAGDATSQLLSTTLHPTLSLALSNLSAGTLPEMKTASWSNLLVYLKPSYWVNLMGSGTTFTPQNVIGTIQNTSVPLLRCRSAASSDT
jgi:pyruvate dehydrogenase phosphatase